MLIVINDDKLPFEIHFRHITYITYMQTKCKNKNNDK